MNQGMNYADAIFLVYKESHASSTDCTTYHAYVAAVRAWENNSSRYQCFFNRFNPVWCGLKKSWATKPAKNGFFANRTRSNSTNRTNLKRLIPIEHDLWLVDLNYSFECDWLIELSDNKLSNKKLPNNKLSNNKLSDDNLASELVKNRSFLNQSQSRKLWFLWLIFL